MRAYLSRAVNFGLTAGAAGASGVVAGAAASGIGYFPAGAGFDPAASASRVPGWPRNWRVGANSPSLCPTISSVTYTLMNVLPLWTRNVMVTNSGEIVDRRDHVLIGSWLPTAFSFATFAMTFGSIYGPFLSERLIDYLLFDWCLPVRRNRTMKRCDGFLLRRVLPPLASFVPFQLHG